MLDITTLAAWGEFIGGIAVVVSLIYLASQIRMNTRTVRAASFGDVLNVSSQFGTMVADPEMASLYLRGLDDSTGLSAEDQVRFDALLNQSFNQFYRVWHLHQQTLLDDGLFEAHERVMADMLDKPGLANWWESAQQRWPAEFREFVRRAVSA
jgi:hypothetical protein